jgi:hypothetical protein
MNVHVLPDRRLLDAETSLALLVERARSLQVFGPTVNFDAPVWDLTDVKRARPSDGNQTHQLFFTRVTERETRSMEGRVAFEPAFANLVKAMFTLREHARPSGAALYRKILQAARHLYETLENRGFDPIRLTSDDFESAAMALKNTSPGYRYLLGQELWAIAAFVNKHALTKAPIVFKNPYPRQRYDAKSDEKSRKKRASKMPSEELIDAVIAMSDIVREKGDDHDILPAAIIEILLCAPWRINEALMMLANCIRRQTATDPKTGKTLNALGFAHHGSKGADDTIKWVPPKMVEVAERAMADILRITQPTRNVALWMERHPGRAFLAEPFRLADPSTQLTMEDVAAALGLGSDSAARYWLNANKVAVSKRGRRHWCVLADLEAAVLRLQPRLPPAFPQRLSKYLLLVPRHFFSQSMPDMSSIVTFVSDASIGCFLSTGSRYKSVFERLGILDANGQPYSITSHAFRHYLNTIAKDGELSEFDIARWSGRKRIEQNAAYDHTDGRQLMKRMREMLNTGAMRGSLPETIEKLPPAEREEFIQARINTAHLTDIGACIQDWSLAPCPKHGSCASCGDHLIIKGNEVHKARAERLLAEHEAMLAQAKAEMDEGTYGASDWVAHNEKMVAGLKKTVAVHENREIPVGTVVQV